MSNLPHRPSGAVDALSGREVSIGRRPAPPRVQRAVHQAVAVEHGHGIVQAARVRAVEYVASDSSSVRPATACMASVGYVLAATETSWTNSVRLSMPSGTTGKDARRA